MASSSKAGAGWNNVYDLVKKIPKCKVISYGQLAHAVRLRGGARAAGRAMWACPKGMGVPWHRVVGAGGRILLQEPRAALQRRLLESEGVQFAGGRVDMTRHEWTPKRGGRRSSTKQRSSRPTRNVV
jgi:methylated-DNA-protein-cysteine methyltransferase related protein